MVYEESLMMSVDSTPNKKGARSLNSSASSVLSVDSKPLRGTWAEEVREEFGYSDESRKILNSSNESSTNANSSKREISLEFIDGANEKKFERLVKEEKLKTPFKRRHPHAQGNASRSNSPSSSGSDAGGGDKSNDGCRTSKFSNYRDEKRVRSNSYTSSSSSSSFIESNPAILERRQKQIDYGKNTIAYDRYIEMVPRAKRTRDHPQTPNKYGKYSRRAFDGLIKIWRKQLHYYDPPTDQTGNGNDSSSDSDSD